MRSLGDIQARWNILFNNAIGVNLRQAVRDGEGIDPCEDGLRSVCWKAFLLFGPLSKVSWTKKMAESRNAYISLRSHFLRFIDNPDDLHSTADPLADDETSPWSTLRQDEASREEILQDVTRCMQENYFYREPATQNSMLDILFIYSKLNPDIGYRQGMHELLAPIIWVVHHDAFNKERITTSDSDPGDIDFAIDILDNTYVEHDTFSLFCAVMQTAKILYEMGEDKDSSMIVTQSRKIHDELLADVDPELALHLQVIGVLPQIYSIRWMRLLFGREFEFKDLLCIWDLLLAENIRLDLINMTCVIMLLRIRWALVDADYTTAIVALTRYGATDISKDPRSLVRDALYLEQSRDAETGATLIQGYSGRRPKYLETRAQARNDRLGRLRGRGVNVAPQKPSPAQSPARFSSPQKPLENLFQDIAGGLSRRTEGWNVSKAVRGAVGEVRRNVSSLQSTSPRLGISPTESKSSVSQFNTTQDDKIKALEDKLRELQVRNKALGVMLDDALESLRTGSASGSETVGFNPDSFNLSLAKIQFVSVYLGDPEIPIPNDDVWKPKTVLPEEDESVTSAAVSPRVTAFEGQKKHLAAPTLDLERDIQDDGSNEVETVSQRKEGSPLLKASEDGKTRRLIRPSLAESSFSFMLGENRHRSSFVSSVTALPEARRDSDPKVRPKQSLVEEHRKQEMKTSESEEEGFTLSKLRGIERP